jgi:hypothetical protein
MSRRRYSWDEKRISKYARAGRGTGSGSNYTPWLTTADVPSIGRSHRAFWSKTERVHHFLSDNEYASFLRHCYEDDVVDIREQFPLDRIETILIAEVLGIRHPVDRVSRTPLVMTTDLLVTRKTPRGLREYAYAVKEDKDLQSLRTIEKLEIERIYWAMRGIVCKIQLRSELKTNAALNLAWIFDSDASVESGSAWIARIKSQLKSAVRLYPASPIRLACRLLDNQLGLAIGTALAVVRALLARKELLVDLNLAPPLAEISCSHFSFVEGRT